MKQHEGRTQQRVHRYTRHGMAIEDKQRVGNVEAVREEPQSDKMMYANMTSLTEKDSENSNAETRQENEQESSSNVYGNWEEQKRKKTYANIRNDATMQVTNAGPQ